MDSAAGTVFIVNDAREIRTEVLLAAAGYEVRAFESAEHFLEKQDCEAAGCLLLDLCLPGMSGLDLQRSLVGSARAHPIIFLTGRGDIQTSVQAMKMGALDFLTKPIDAARLLAAVDQAIRLDAAARGEVVIRSMIANRVETLSRRERQVMELVIRGWINKQIGVALDICEKTVKVHRGRMLSKMHVRSVASLVQLLARVGVKSPDTDAADITKLRVRNRATQSTPAHIEMRHNTGGLPISAGLVPTGERRRWVL